MVKGIQEEEELGKDVKQAEGRKLNQFSSVQGRSGQYLIVLNGKLQHDAGTPQAATNHSTLKMNAASRYKCSTLLRRKK